MRVMLLCLLVSCASPDAPRPFVLGPGCWTVTHVPLTQGVTAVVKAHYPQCPDPMATGQTRWHWDTTFVGH